MKEVAISLRSQLRRWKLRLERWLEADVPAMPFVEPSVDTSMLKRIERVTLTDAVATAALRRLSRTSFVVTRARGNGLDHARIA